MTFHEIGRKRFETDVNMLISMNCSPRNKQADMFGCHVMVFWSAYYFIYEWTWIKPLQTIWNELNWLSIESSCDYNNDPSGSTKVKEFFY
jgi:hypothetical protein